jgi:hypothetical protein
VLEVVKQPQMTNANCAGSESEKPNIPVSGGPRSLEKLLALAERCATSSMRQNGTVRPVFFIVADDGTRLAVPISVDTDQEKDASIAAARLVCIARGATAVVSIAEAWMSVKSTGEKIAPPSEDPDRQEILMLLGEDYAGCKQRILPILRKTSGQYSGIGKKKTTSHDLKGRFTNILPSAPPTPEVKAEAMKLLEAMGVESSITTVEA